MIESAIDNKLGMATFACAIVNPTAGQQSISVASVGIAPQSGGSAALSFDLDETKVLANDGLGTDVLRAAQGGDYRFDSFASGSATSTGRSFIVFSPTHPNENSWYSKPLARFVWLGAPDALYRYTFDATPDTVPTVGHIVKGSEADIPIPGDGVYYFHLSLASGGPTAHYRIQSDRTPPTITGMNLSSNDITEGDVVRCTFNAEDPVSGIQKNYYVELANHLFLPIGTDLFVPFLEQGEQKITLRVYDNAGNYTEQSRVVHVAPKR